MRNLDMIFYVDGNESGRKQKDKEEDVKEKCVVNYCIVMYSNEG